MNRQPEAVHKDLLQHRPALHKAELANRRNVRLSNLRVDIEARRLRPPSGSPDDLAFIHLISLQQKRMHVDVGVARTPSGGDCRPIMVSVLWLGLTEITSNAGSLVGAVAACAAVGRTLSAITSEGHRSMRTTQQPTAATIPVLRGAIGSRASISFITSHLHACSRPKLPAQGLLAHTQIAHPPARLNNAFA